MKAYLKYALLLLFATLASPALADAQFAQHLHELRSESYRAATLMLIDNNLYERNREPTHREAYKDALKNMDQSLRLLNNPPDLRTPYNLFARLIHSLEVQSEDEPSYLLSRINDIMMTHARIDKAIAARYAELIGEVDEALLALHQQSLETNQLLLLYQNNMYSSIGVYFLETNTNEDMFHSIDASITARATTLKKLLPDLADTLQSLDKQYSFIQPRLLAYHSDWVPTIAAFYLLRNTATLNQLARDQLRS